MTKVMFFSGLAFNIKKDPLLWYVLHTAKGDFHKRKLVMGESYSVNNIYKEYCRG
jgi:hypothetical protein